MDFENMDNPAEESLPEEIVEESEDSEQDLDTVIGDEPDQEEESEEKEPEVHKEPGYVQTRISKAVSKAVAEAEARFAAQMQEIEAKYAPLQERLMEMDAQELVRTRKVADIETARELVRLRNGQTAPEPEPQPRQENGQFAPKDDPATTARIEMLKHQAAKIKASTGVDVIAEWNSNPEIQNKVIKGEMDFYDVAEQMKPRKRTPSPTRSPNGANGVGPNSIENMTDAQFRKLDRMLDEGVRFTIKR